MGRKPKDWKYTVTVTWTGSYEATPKKEVLEMIQDSMEEEFGFVPDPCEIKIEEDK